MRKDCDKKQNSFFHLDVVANESQEIIPNCSQLIALWSEREPHFLQAIELTNKSQIAFTTGRRKSLNRYYVASRASLTVAI